MNVKECKNDLDIILEIEGGELIIQSKKDLQKVKNICRQLASSQGFYGRLLRDIEEAEACGIEYPVIL